VIEMFTHPQGLPFAVALTVMGLLTVLEVGSTLIGTQLSGLVDNLIPDFDLDTEIDLDLDLDADTDITPTSGPGNSLAGLLSWLRIDQVPFLIFLVVFLASFGLLGLSIQSLANQLLGAPLSASLASVATLPLTLPALRWMVGGLAKVLPSDETEVISRESFIGAQAQITLGKAKQGSPAEAKLSDTFGTTHYVMVEPQQVGVHLEQGQLVRLIARKDDTVFFAESTQLPAGSS